MKVNNWLFWRKGLGVAMILVLTIGLSVLLLGVGALQEYKRRSDFCDAKRMDYGAGEDPTCVWYCFKLDNGSLVKEYHRSCVGEMIE